MENNNSNTNVTSPADLAVIEAALAAAKARKAAGPKKRVIAVLSPEEKASAAAAKVAARETRAAERAAAREARVVARANRGPAHLKKVAKAAALLPVLSESGTDFLNSVRDRLDAAQQLALAAHIQHLVRVDRTTSAATVRATLKVGDRVRIVGGDPRYVGVEGTVTKAQRIRCFVEVPGKSKPLYLFTSDCEPVA